MLQSQIESGLLTFQKHLESKLCGHTTIEYARYKDDPVGFGEDQLGRTYTEDQKTFLLAIRDYESVTAMTCNAVGKSFVVSDAAIWIKTCFPRSKVFLAAAPPESNLTTILFGELSTTYERLKKTLFLHDRKTTKMIKRSDENFIQGLTIPTSGTEATREAKFSGKHAPVMLFLFDEADAIPDECFKGAESCASGGKVRMVNTFNPREQAGYAYRAIRDNQTHVVTMSAFNHPNVLTGEDVVPGAVTRMTVLRRINEWCRPLAKGEVPGKEDFELPEFLVGCVGVNKAGLEYDPLKSGWYRITEPSFSYMVLGQYPSQNTNQLVSREWVTAARDRWNAYVRDNGETPPDHVSATGGLDVADEGDDSNVLTFKYGGYVERPITWSGVDPTVTADKAEIEYGKRDMSRINVDGTGVGSSVAPALSRKGCIAEKIMVSGSPTKNCDLGEFKILRDQVLWAVREWLRTDPGAMLPPDELLIEELLIPQYSCLDGYVRIDKNDVLKEKLKRSADRLMSLAMNFAPGGVFSKCDMS